MMEGTSQRLEWRRSQSDLSRTQWESQYFLSGCLDQDVKEIQAGSSGNTRGGKNVQLSALHFAQGRERSYLPKALSSPHNSSLRSETLYERHVVGTRECLSQVAF